MPSFGGGDIRIPSLTPSASSSVVDVELAPVMLYDISFEVPRVVAAGSVPS